MGKYKATADYRSVFQRNGSNEHVVIGVDETVELDDELAGFIDRDCPGVLVRAKGVAKKAAAKKAPKNAAKKAPKKAPAKK